MKYLQIYRLEKASERLISENVKIAQMAFESGFSDQNYFARIFRAHFGMTPSTYRKQTRRVIS